MLRKEQNDLLTQTGPGTPMGQMFRLSWQPALLAEELPENECPPVRVKLMGERLLAWRDTQGRYALTDEFCAHRGVSLWFGRNEHNGLRCPYHGWKYDHTGQCIEVPSEPSESGFCQKIKLKSYPLIQRGGILWAYMGPPEMQPPFPEFEWSMLPAAHCYNTKRLQECNYLQAMEGGIDSSHVSFLHSGDMHRDPLHRNTKGAHYQADQKPKFEVVESAGGLFIAARRNAEAGHYYWRITQWIMPWYTMVPPYGHNALNAHAWVPIDDENCFTWTFTYHPTRPLSDIELDVMRKGGGIHVPILPADHQQGQRLPDGSRGTEARRNLLRRSRHRHAGRFGAGKHGADPGPLQGEPRLHRQCHHHGASPTLEGRARPAKGHRTAGPGG